MIDLQELKRLAHEYIRLMPNVAIGENYIPFSKARSEFEYAVNPQAILELIERLELAAAELAKYRQQPIQPGPYITTGYDLIA